MTPTIPMPGALRWREMYPLIDGDGSCSLIYDLERAAVLEVPEDLRFYVAPALETGDLDDGLLSWLVQEDLLTAESSGGWSGDAACLDVSGCWDLGAIHRVDDQVCAHLGPRSESEVSEALEPVFKQSLGASRVQLCLSEFIFGGAQRGLVVSARAIGVQLSEQRVDDSSVEQRPSG